MIRNKQGKWHNPKRSYNIPDEKLLGWKKAPKIGAFLNDDHRGEIEEQYEKYIYDGMLFRIYRIKNNWHGAMVYRKTLYAFFKELIKPDYHQDVIKDEI